MIMSQESRLGPNSDRISATLYARFQSENSIPSIDFKHGEKPSQYQNRLARWHKDMFNFVKKGGDGKGDNVANNGDSKTI